jgi:bifunctional polynucleotide phosphatase/kinase
LIYSSEGLEHREKIAGFDLDGTIVRTQSGKVFPKDTNDWMLWNQKVATKIQQLHKEGFKIVIFTNQRGIEKGKVRPHEFKNKIVNVAKVLGVPLQVTLKL